MIGIQTNSLDSLNFETDTSLLLASEFVLRGYSLFFFEPQNLYLSSGEVRASGYIVDLDYQNKTYKTSETDVNLLYLKLVLVRHNPPFDTNYLHNTYMLDVLEDKIPFFNKPSAIRNTPEKLSALKFPHHIPDTIVTNQIDLVLNFYNKHKKIVLKAPYGFGGNEVVVIENDKHSTIESFIKTYGYIIAQEFLYDIKDGDKRVFIVDGEVLGAITRVPQDKSFLSNLGQGATAYKTSLSLKEQKICEDVAAFLQAQDIFFAGVDLIGGRLIEINVTSPTALKSYNSLYGANIEKAIIDKMLEMSKAL